ncbi:hypothetical protein S7711_08531 [Stachybotrys chartarum IBT 7711]|uniref:Heterokaryon incompatibility domain-containing protein n=1 Tax=Stachybotrys chartarum (strain CBS 109288 / IBT 7711) TaxID=1280523 RepID=A0A084AZV2_STACB|nr:hypothetical protein S7711_08531 [Stachybotrys chartarum IBT 7711]
MAESLYEPLNVDNPSIRLFVLLPDSNQDSPLQGRLQTVSLVSPPAYEALSYAWGHPENTQPVSINGQTVLVTPNLATALRHLRLDNEPRVLWIDALSINQASLTERAHQVTLMAQIYSQCVRDILWLGPVADSENRGRSFQEETLVKGLEMIKNIADRNLLTLRFIDEYHRIHDDWDEVYLSSEEYRQALSRAEESGVQAAELEINPFDTVDQNADTDGNGESSSAQDHSSRKMLLGPRARGALKAVLTSASVWKRIWIMQELSRAPRILLVAKRTSLDWDRISGFLGDTPYADAFHATFSHGYAGPMMRRIFHNVQIVDHQRRILRDETAGPSKLLDVLARFRTCRATDPRDKIFGLLGLATDDVDIKVDYRSSTAQVYANVTAALINHMGNLDIICQGPWHIRKDGSYINGDEQLEELPSWAIDFRTSGSVPLFAQRSIFNAGRATCQVPCRVLDSKALLTRGVVLGSVGPIRQVDYHAEGSTKLPGDRRDNASRAPVDWLKRYLGFDVLINPDSEPSYITGERAFTAFWRTLLADCGAYPMSRITLERVVEEDALLRNSWLEYIRRYSQEQSETDAEDTQYAQCAPFHEPRLANMFMHLISRWSFSITDNGLYTLITKPTREGDVLACIDGGKVPVVLRPANPESERQYQIITVAYVHGFMDMEATESISLRDKLGLKEEELLLV